MFHINQDEVGLKKHVETCCTYCIEVTECKMVLFHIKILMCVNTERVALLHWFAASQRQVDKGRLQSKLKY